MTTHELFDTRPGGDCLPARRRAGAPKSPAKAMEEICMVRPHTCVSVHCDQCADTPAGPGFEAHYPDETTAFQAAMAADWLVAVDGRLLCSACGPVLICEADGHEFGPWRSWSATRAPQRREYRNCRRCSLHESRPAPTYGEVA